MLVFEARFVEQRGADDRGVVHLVGRRVAAEAAPGRRQRRAADDVLRVVVEEPIEIEARHQRVGRVELVIDARVHQALAVVADIRGDAAKQRRRHRAGEVRRAILAGVLSGGKEEGPVRRNRPARGARDLVQHVGHIGRRDSRRARGGGPFLQPAWTAFVERFAVRHVGARLGDDVDGSAGGPAEFSGEGVRQHLHLLHGRNRHGREHRLPAPGLVAGGAVHRVAGFAPAAGAGDEIRGVDEQIPRSFRRPERRVQQRERCDLAAEHRHVFNLLRIEAHAQLRIAADAGGGAVHRDLARAAAHRQANVDRGGLAAAQDNVAQRLGGETGFAH